MKDIGSALKYKNFSFLTIQPSAYSGMNFEKVLFLDNNPIRDFAAELLPDKLPNDSSLLQ